MVKQLLMSVLLMAGLTTVATAQRALSLDSCRQMALRHNHEVLISQQEHAAAASLEKAAKTQMLPDISANGAYTYMNKLLSYDISTPELNLPVGSLAPDGSWTITPGDTDNTWVDLGNGTFAPLDSEGVPFDPTINPEKLIISDWAYIPAIDTTLEIGQHHNFLGGVNITQPVYMGGKIRELVKVAGYAEAIAESGVAKAQADVVYHVDEAYYRVLQVQQKVVLATEAVSLLENIVEDVMNYKEEGLITQNEVMQAQVKLNEANLNLIKAQNGLKLSQMALNQAIGIELSQELILTDTLDNQIFRISDGNYAGQAMVHRPELHSLEQAMNIAESQVKIARSRYLPNVGVTASYLFVTPNVFDSFGEEFGSDWNVMVACNIPIFHWNDRKHTLDASKNESVAAQLRYDQACEMITLQVEQARQHCIESAETVMLSEKNLLQAKENLKIHRDNLEEGMCTVNDVLQAEVMWQKAYDQLIEARAQNRMNYSYLENVSGISLK